MTAELTSDIIYFSKLVNPLMTPTFSQYTVIGHKMSFQCISYGYQTSALEPLVKKMHKDESRSSSGNMNKQTLSFNLFTYCFLFYQVHISIRVNKEPYSVMGEKSRQIADQWALPNSHYICLCNLFHLMD